MGLVTFFLRILDWFDNTKLGKSLAKKRELKERRALMHHQAQLKAIDEGSDELVDYYKKKELEPKKSLGDKLALGFASEQGTNPLDNFKNNLAQSNTLNSEEMLNRMGMGSAPPNISYSKVYNNTPRNTRVNAPKTRVRRKSSTNHCKTRSPRKTQLNTNNDALDPFALNEQLHAQDKLQQRVKELLK